MDKEMNNKERNNSVSDFKAIKRWKSMSPIVLCGKCKKCDGEVARVVESE